MYIVKISFVVVFILFYFCAQNIDFSNSDNSKFSSAFSRQLILQINNFGKEFKSKKFYIFYKNLSCFPTPLVFDFGFFSDNSTYIFSKTFQSFQSLNQLNQFSSYLYFEDECGFFTSFSYQNIFNDYNFSFISYIIYFGILINIFSLLFDFFLFFKNRHYEFIPQ